MAEANLLQIIQNARRKRVIEVLIELNGRADVREVVRRVESR